MEISKLKLTWKYLTGGVDSVVEYLLNQFSTQVLSKANPEHLAKYCSDVKALSLFIADVVVNHKDDLGEHKTSVAKSIIAGLGDLASALSDGKVTKNELDHIVDEIGAMVKLFHE